MASLTLKANAITDTQAEYAGRTSRFASGAAIVAYLALIKLIAHLTTAGVYGLFIDELYFLACGEHLAWGYVDFPPLTALQAWIARTLLGGSVFAIHLLPALAGAGLILLTGKIARELGCGRFAQGLAALCVLVAPVYLSFDSYLSMNSIEPLLWMGCALMVIRIIKTGNTRLWLWFGVLAGIGMQNKHTMAMFGMAVVAGLLLTGQRRLMGNRWFLLGGLIALLIFLPNLIWMIRHHFPHLELLANIKRNGRDVAFSPVQFFGMQIILLHPLTFPVWMAGLWRLLISPIGKHYRGLGLAYFVVLIALLLLEGKVYYLAPIYPVLLAAGAWSVEGWRRYSIVRKLGFVYLALLTVSGALIAPTAMPILPPETYLRYTQALHLSQPRIEHRTTNAMPQFFADRLGWPEMVAAVAKVYDSLSPDERARTAIFGNDYGQCGAIDYYGPALGLPKSIGNHLSYWYWGPGPYTGDTMIVLGDNREGAESHFEEVIEAGEVGHPYAMRQEHFKIFLCRKPKGWTLPDIWPELKNWN